MGVLGVVFDVDVLSMLVSRSLSLSMSSSWESLLALGVDVVDVVVLGVVFDVDVNVIVAVVVVADVNVEIVVAVKAVVVGIVVSLGS
jgi:hypothetical protein